MSVIIENRKVYFNYHIEDRIEAGIVLLGSEVKSIKAKNVNILDSFVVLKKGEPYLLNMNITKYHRAFSGDSHDPSRDKKLLLHKKQIAKMFGKTAQKGFSIVPLNLHLKSGIIKVELAIVKGKTEYDKRETIKKRDNAKMEKML